MSPHVCLAAALCALTLGGSPSPARAAPVAATRGVRYHVDCDGGDDASDGRSPEAPWRSLGRVNRWMRSLAPGDVVALKAGTTCAGQLTITASGAPGKPLTFTAYGRGGKPVIDPHNRGEFAIALGRNVSHVVLDGLKIHNTVRDASGAVLRDGGLADPVVSRSSGIRMGVRHAQTEGGRNVVRNVEIVNVGYGIEVLNDRNTIGPNNYVHDLRMQLNDDGAGRCTGRQPDPCNNDYGASALLIEADGNDVFANRLVRLRARSYDYGHDGSAFELFTEGAITARRNRIHGNWIQDVNTFVEATGAVSENRFYANVIVDAGNQGGVLHGGARMSGNRFENNVFWPGSRSGEVAIWFGREAPGTVYRNNVIGLAPGQYVTSVFPTPFDALYTHEHNLYWRIDGGPQGKLGITLRAGERYADPSFVAPARHDFRLRPGSPAIDAGAPVAHSTDHAGTPVPQRAAPDIGAFELR
jgi:hypothetical protein